MTPESRRYSAVHKWVYHHFGKADYCELCIKPAKRYEWSNVNGTYRRIRSDWRKLCPSCHRKADITDTTRENMSKSHKGKVSYSYPVVSFSKNGELVNTYSSAMEAERMTGILHTSIVNNLKGRSKSAGGFIWNYHEKN